MQFNWQRFSRRRSRAPLLAANVAPRMLQLRVDTRSLTPQLFLSFTNLSQEVTSLETTFLRALSGAAQALMHTVQFQTHNQTGVSAVFHNLMQRDTNADKNIIPLLKLLEMQPEGSG